MLSLQRSLPTRLTWALGGPERTLEFSWIAEQQGVDLSYFPSGPLPGPIEIPLPGDPDPSSIEVDSLNCSLKEGQDWTYSGLGLHFSAATCLQEGGLHLSYKTRPQALLRFPLAANQSTPPYHLIAERQVPGQAWQAIDVAWERGELVFRKEDYYPGAKLRVHYQEAYLEAGLVAVPRNVAQDTMSVAAMPRTCKLSDLLIAGDFLQSNCSAAPRESMTLVFEQTLQASSIDGSELLPLRFSEKARWRILVDGREEFGFQRKGNRFTLFPSGSKGQQASLEAEIKL